MFGILNGNIFFNCVVFCGSIYCLYSSDSRCSHNRTLCCLSPDGQSTVL